MADEEKAKTSRGAQSTDGTVSDAPTPATEKAQNYAPIEPSDDKANPTLVSVPKTPEEVAEEGTALANEGAEATGGNQPVIVDSAQPVAGKRVWSLDADHNVALRNRPAADHPDLVEFGA